jgi:hypothetical protein
MKDNGRELHISDKDAEILLSPATAHHFQQLLILNVGQVWPDKLRELVQSIEMLPKLAELHLTFTARSLRDWNENYLIPILLKPTISFLQLEFWDRQIIDPYRLLPLLYIVGERPAEQRLDYLDIFMDGDPIEGQERETLKSALIEAVQDNSELSCRITIGEDVIFED